LKIADIIIPPRIRKHMGDVEALAASIKTVGLLHPVVVDEKGNLIAGARRIAACKMLGRENVVAHVVKNLGEARRTLQAEGEENTCRLDFAPSEAVAYKRAMEPAVKAEAAERRKTTQGRPSKTRAKTAPVSAPKSRDVVAAATGKGRTTVSLAEKVVAAAEADPSLLPVVEKMDKTGNVAAAVREVKRAEHVAKLEDIKTKEVKAAIGQYDVLVIDPPWPMVKIERDERPNQSEMDYPTMTEPQLEALALPMVESCHVWLWTTHRFLPMAFHLLETWGLKYVCAFVWHKPGGFQPVGLPQYNCEFALYARKGTPKFVDTKALPVCFNAPRGKHSEKPQEFYETIRRVTAGRRLDMFSRRVIEGFDAWGLEA